MLTVVVAVKVIDKNAIDPRKLKEEFILLQQEGVYTWHRIYLTLSPLLHRV